MPAPTLAVFASRPEKSRGRRHLEPESATRDCFQRDRDRIIHSVAFRRLEYKTQVFVNSEGDHFRTRLTHTLEVAQIARSIARYLKLNEDLAEALALAHDLGHPPFGHAGEEALDEMMQPFGGFDHNGQSLAVVVRLERRYPAFDGLNLTWESLEGIVKHNGPLVGGGRTREVPRDIREYIEQQDLEIGTHAGPEAQVAALSDDIAYNNHDIDDGLRAGLFTVEQLQDVPLVGRIFRDVAAEFTNIDQSVAIHEAIRRLIGEMVEDCLNESILRLERTAPKSIEELRTLPASIVAFSPEMARIDRGIREFLRENMYRHFKVNRMTSKARRVVREMFTLLLNEPRSLPTEWQQGIGAPGSEQTARIVCDYIAGMTDRFALDEHSRLIDVRASAS